MSQRRIAGYTLIRELGRGGMGAVFEALSPEGATVAVKRITWPELADARARWEAVERFQREARAARSLRHPNICQVLDCGAHEDSFFIVMEFLDGDSLRELIRLAGAIRPERAIEIMAAVAEGLAYAHGQGIVHRDIKPENIMVLHRGEVKLTDFGLASAAHEVTLTDPGALVGTLCYISPEQVRGESADARSDLFSLGATFYEMLTGARAFGAEERAAVLHQILTLDPPAVMGVPERVSATLARCLCKQPQGRFQSAREMLTSLTGRAPQGALTVPGRPPTPPPVASVSDVRTPTPPPRLASPEAEEADVRARANYRWEANLQEDTGELELGDIPGQGAAALEDGVYIASGARAYRLPTPDLMPEFVFEARVRKLEEMAGEEWRFVWILYGLNAPGGSRLSVAFLDEGGIVIDRYYEEAHATIAGARGQHPARSRDGILLKLVRRGASLHASVNGEHVLTAEDFRVRLGRLYLQVGDGVKVACSSLLVEGVDLDRELQQAAEHRRNLEEREARQLLGHVARYAPSWKGAVALLEEVRPDRRDTVLIVVGTGLSAQLTDGVAAGQLRDYINARTAGPDTRWAAVVTDEGVLREERAMDCPLIAVGGPDANRVTARLAEELPKDPGAPGWSYLCCDLPHGVKRAALWGRSPVEGAPSITDYFISSGLLDRFLDVVWGSE